MDILKYVDHTILKADARFEDIRRLVREARDYGCASACIGPAYIPMLRGEFPQLSLATVVGFPLGFQSKATKLMEAKEAVENGADEIDMVANIGAIKSGDFAYVEDEIRQIKEALGAKVLKVIVETCYLNLEEKIRICKIVEEAGADFIKTSTGFGPAGASLEDVRLFKEVSPNLKVKASGGIGTIEEAQAFILAGADRIGASKLVEAWINENN